jgi:hypothetical protein
LLPYQCPGLFENLSTFRVFIIYFPLAKCLEELTDLAKSFSDGSLEMGILKNSLNSLILTNAPKIAAQAATSGRRVHHRYKVEIYPWRMAFSRVAALDNSSSGSIVSINVRDCILTLLFLYL